MVSLYWHCRHLDGHKINVEVIHGGRKTLLSTIRLCRMDIICSVALDMSGCLHQIDPYLLRDE